MKIPAIAFLAAIYMVSTQAIAIPAAAAVPQTFDNAPGTCNPGIFTCSEFANNATDVSFPICFVI
jgi:hypothetical protein